MKRKIEIVETTHLKLLSLRLNFSCDYIILLKKGFTQAETVFSVFNIEENNSSESLQNNDIEYLVFLSGIDKFDPRNILVEVKKIFDKQIHDKLTLLIPYKTPPEFGPREDGKVHSFIISKEQFDLKVFEYSKYQFWKAAYLFTYRYLNSVDNDSIEIFQVSHPRGNRRLPLSSPVSLKHDAMVILPHKGSPKLLTRCLNYLGKINHRPAEVNICFDDNSFKNMTSTYLADYNVFVNRPANVGPYLGRHYSIIKSSKKYFFLQDSDDISTKDRFFKQLKELNNRKLDMVGSHELRIDQFSKSIVLFRFPLDVNKSLKEQYLHPLFHPTTMITRKAYMKTNGFSTNLSFAYDTQFLIRSYFYLKIGNVDEFLYIRFKRPNSLTTSPKTKIGGSNLRKFLMWRWRSDFKLILEGKLELSDSSLAVQHHEFPYEMSKIESSIKQQ
jgi:hypothetical protein